MAQKKRRLSKQNDDDPFDHAERPEIVEDGEDLLGDRVGLIVPYRIPEEEDREHGRSGRDRQDDVDLSGDEYWVGAVNENMMAAPVTSSLPTYQAGRLFMSSRCIAARDCD